MFSPKIMSMMMLQIVFIVGPLVLGSVLLGKFMDAQLNTSPWLKVFFAVGSSVLACVIAYRIGMSAVAKVDQALPWPKKTATTNTDPQNDNNTESQPS